MDDFSVDHWRDGQTYMAFIYIDFLGESELSIAHPMQCAGHAGSVVGGLCTAYATQKHRSFWGVDLHGK